MSESLADHEADEMLTQQDRVQQSLKVVLASFLRDTGFTELQLHDPHDTVGVVPDLYKAAPLGAGAAHMSIYQNTKVRFLGPQGSSASILEDNLLTPSSSAVPGPGLGEEGGEAITALPTFVVAVEMFIQHLIARARSCADIVSRSQISEVDVCTAYTLLGMDVRSLIEYGSELTKASQGAQAELLIQGQAEQEDYILPFAQSLPNVLANEGLKYDRPAHIPDYMPTFPDAHTFVRTSVFEPMEISYADYRVERAKRQRAAQASLLKIRAPLKSDVTCLIKTFPEHKIPELRVICKPCAFIPRKQQLLVRPEVRVENPEDDDDGDNTLTRILDFETEMEAHAAHEAKLEVEVLPLENFLWQ